MVTDKLQLFFHQDFDGICSAAVFVACAKKRGLLDCRQVVLSPVDYGLKQAWAASELPRASAIVDFCITFEPIGGSTITRPRLFGKNGRRPLSTDSRHVWDTRYKSCPRLVLDSMASSDIHQDLSTQFRDHLYWSDVIDAAEYASPKQVVESEEPALQINLSLATDRTSDYLNFLVGCLKERSLSEVANTQEVASRFFRAMQWQKQAIAYMEKVGEVRNGVAFFDLTEKSEFFYRYGPYYLWPDTRFAVAVYRNGRNWKVTVSSSPWLRFRGPDLSLLCESYGGEGHPQVGGILAPNRRRAIGIGQEIVRVLRGETAYTEHLPFRQRPIEDERIG